MQILYCKFREVGYYTQWNFLNDLAIVSFDSMERLPSDIAELDTETMIKKDTTGDLYCAVFLRRGIREQVRSKTRRLC